MGTYVHHDRDGYAHYAFSKYTHHVGGDWGKVQEFYKGVNGGFFIQYPPLRYLADHIFLMAFGAHASSMYIANTFWWLALFVVSFFLGSLVGRSAMAGAVTCSIIAFHPDLSILTYLVGLDLPQIVVVGLAVYLLLSLPSHKEWYWPLVAGIAIGLAILTKPTTVMFLIPFSFGLLFLKTNVAWKPWRCLLIAWLTGSAIASIFYVPLLSELYQKTLWQTTHEPSPIREAVWFYSSVFLRLASPLELALYAYALISLALKRDRWLLPLAIFWIFSIALHTPFFVRIEQIIYPAYFALALILARSVGVASSNTKHVFRTVILPLVIVVIFSWNFWEMIFNNPGQQAAKSGDKYLQLMFRTPSQKSVPPFYFLEADSPFLNNPVDEEAVLSAGLGKILKAQGNVPPLLLSCQQGDLPELDITMVFAVGLLSPGIMAKTPMFSLDQHLFLPADTKLFLRNMNDSDTVLALLPGSCKTDPLKLAHMCRITSEPERQNLIRNFALFCRCTKPQGQTDRLDRTLFSAKRIRQCEPTVGLFNDVHEEPVLTNDR